MSGDTPTLVRMANQIATNLGVFPHETAVAEVAQHIRNFWDPRMRRRLLDHVAAGGAGLSPLALEAARALDG